MASAGEQRLGRNVTAKTSDDTDKTRTYVLYWISPPFYTEIRVVSRREKYRVTKSRVPIILRDLAPNTFSPKEVWEAEKNRVEDDAAAITKQETKSSSAKGGGKKKENKKDEIIRKREEERKQDLYSRDQEQLQNKVKRGEWLSLVQMKPLTELGDLWRLLQILKHALTVRDKNLAFDVFWAIESNQLYQSAAIEAKAAKEAKDDSKSDKDKKKSSKEKDKKAKDKKDAGKEKKVVLSPAGELVGKVFKRELKDVKKLREKEDMVEFQLNSMYDRLPPLSPFTRGFKLEEWQKRILHSVDRGRSAIVCAPTSSGKTVISTYAAQKYDRVLFVIPTEPLVWQVGAMFHKLLNGGVAMCTDQMAYRETSGDIRVLVGTPCALESALTKAIGMVGAEHENKKDYSVLDGGFDFQWAIFDEIHCLDGEEGGALQRLIRGVTCPFLALSATIGNAEALRDWWKCVRGDHLDLVLSPEMEESTAAAKRDPTPELIERSVQLRRQVTSMVEGEKDGQMVDFEQYQGRFINLQRHLQTDQGLLKPLHPCAALDLDLLREPNFMGQCTLAFTPPDMWALWCAFTKYIEPRSLVEDCNPDTFFAKYENSMRITLIQAKEYEDKLKTKLTALAAESITNQDLDRQMQALLLQFRPGSKPSPSPSSSTTSTTAGAEEAKTAADASSSSASSSNAEHTDRFNIYGCVNEFIKEGMVPALCFQLDKMKCIKLFKSLLAELENRQDEKHPNWQSELEEQAVLLQKKKEEQIKKEEKNAKLAEEEMKEGAGSDALERFVDITMPHPEFVLSPPTARLSRLELDEILKEIARDAGKSEMLKESHPYLRALRRGFAIYIDDVAFSTYRRIIQRLAQQGKLAVVFSDSSLAYGVNMPFRCAAFCGGMSGLLTPLMEQQMNGRAGRRGLDTQGHIVYIGMEFGKVRQLMLGKVGSITGRRAYYPQLALQLLLAREVKDEVGNFLTVSDHRMLAIGSGVTLEEYLNECGLLDTAEDDVEVGGEDGEGAENRPRLPLSSYKKTSLYRSIKVLTALNMTKVGIPLEALEDAADAAEANEGGTEDGKDGDKEEEAATKEGGGAAAAPSDASGSSALEALNSAAKKRHAKLLPLIGTLSLAIDRRLAAMVWECRNYPRESFALAAVMPLLYKRFVEDHMERGESYGDNEGVQVEFLSFLVQIVQRTAPPPPPPPLPAAVIAAAASVTSSSSSSAAAEGVDAETKALASAEVAPGSSVTLSAAAAATMSTRQIQDRYKELTDASVPLRSQAYFANPSRAEEYEEMDRILANQQAVMKELGRPARSMLLPEYCGVGQAIDATIWQVVQLSRISNSVEVSTAEVTAGLRALEKAQGDDASTSSPAHARQILASATAEEMDYITRWTRHSILRRVWDLGNILRLTANCIAQPKTQQMDPALNGQFARLSLLFRKCFTRIKYILADTIREESLDSKSMKLAADSIFAVDGEDNPFGGGGFGGGEEVIVNEGAATSGSA